MLVRQTRNSRGAHDEPAIGATADILSGLGSPVPVEIERGNPHVGKTLAEIKLRGLTGATVLAIQRGNESITIPAGRDSLQEGDVLAIAGTHEAVEAAKELLAIKD
jgi:CPA2 family monovalent cation:H+ antiporter-2